MAFSFFEKALSILPSLFIPGGAGTALSSGVASLLGGGATAQGPQFAQVQAPAFVGTAASSLSRIPPGVLGMAATVGIGTISLILQRAKENTGRRVTRREIIQAAKVCGIETAAATFGLSVTDVCQVVAMGAPRRRRGISAADLRRTRSTIRKVSTIRKDLAALGRK